MLIKALCDYADKKQSDIPNGFEKHLIHFRIMLTENGNLDDIIDIRGNELSALLPIRKSKSATCSEIIEHRSKYIFGITHGKNGLEVVKNKKNEAACFKEFVKTNHDFLADLDSKIAKAVKMFMEKWNPEDELDNSKILSIKAGDFNTSWFDFSLVGHPEITLENDESVKQKYIRDYLNKSDDAAGEKGICCVLGEKLQIADKHDKISFHGGKCPLISMKETAYQSYGKENSYNSSVSIQAMKKYTATLNNLIKDGKHTAFLSEMVILFFAMNKDDSNECAFFSSILGNTNDKKTEQNIASLIKQVQKGHTSNNGTTDAMIADKKVIFYIIGYTQNKSRISQKFLYRGNFGEMLNNLIKHQSDLMIDPDNIRPVYFSRIAKELKSPKSTDEKVPAPLMSAIMLSALNNTKYPDALLATVIRRVKTDSDEENKPKIKLNDTRAGIIKACLNRKYKKEEITMSWNDDNKNPAYLCGGLFAVYEKIQKESSGVNLNRTIKDSYFASACSRPSSVFPKLAKLAQNHMRKLSEGSEIYYNRMIGDVMSSLDGEFPATLNLDDQGRFIVGYYQMNKKLYTSNKGE